MDIKIPRGVKDYFGSDINLHNAVVTNISELFENYGFNKIKTPIFEDTNLFKRSVGNDTDIVNKEMYTFNDKKGRSITLRPELTSPVVRSYIENKMYGTLSDFHKFYYYGEAFRYERSQSGRYRQFHQMGVEIFNIQTNIIDIEIISLANEIINKLNLNEYVTLKVNTIGTSNDRRKYVEELTNYFEQFKDDLCQDCKDRIYNNPLRILDCKEDVNIIKNAPIIYDYLSNESNEKFKNILKELDKLKIDYEVDSKLVRGLDYYNDLVFEYVFNNEELKYTIIGGGRYDTLISQLSNKEIPAIGFGVGVERLCLALQSVYPNTLEKYKNEIDIYFATQTFDEQNVLSPLMNTLRNNGLRCDMNYLNKKIKSCYKKAEELNAVYIITYIDNNNIFIKNLKTKETIKKSIEKFKNDILTGVE